MKKNISELLKTCGQKSTVSKVVEFLTRDHEFHTLREIEKGTDLRQPQVSRAVSELKKYLTVNEQVKDGGKGRPQKMVKMTDAQCSMYIAEITQRIEKECAEMKDAAAKLTGES